MRASSMLPGIVSCLRLLLLLLAAATVALNTGAAHADVILQQRCTLDSLTPQQAEQRLEWARKCALTFHTSGPGDWVPAGGDPLIREDGSLDLIITIDQTDSWGKVYNVQPQTTDPVTNLLVAPGYLVGSARFQNDDVGYMNRQILGRGIPEEIIPE